MRRLQIAGVTRSLGKLLIQKASSQITHLVWWQMVEIRKHVGDILRGHHLVVADVENREANTMKACHTCIQTTPEAANVCQ